MIPGNSGMKILKKFSPYRSSTDAAYINFTLMSQTGTEH